MASFALLLTHVFKRIRRNYSLSSSMLDRADLLWAETGHLLSATSLYIFLSRTCEFLADIQVRKNYTLLRLDWAFNGNAVDYFSTRKSTIPAHAWETFSSIKEGKTHLAFPHKKRNFGTQKPSFTNKVPPITILLSCNLLAFRSSSPPSLPFARPTQPPAQTAQILARRSPAATTPVPRIPFALTWTLVSAVPSDYSVRCRADEPPYVWFKMKGIESGPGQFSWEVFKE